jgi:hypothetical protein
MTKTSFPPQLNPNHILGLHTHEHGDVDKDIMALCENQPCWEYMATTVQKEGDVHPTVSCMANKPSPFGNEPVKKPVPRPKRSLQAFGGIAGSTDSKGADALIVYC